MLNGFVHCRINHSVEHHDPGRYTCWSHNDYNPLDMAPFQKVHILCPGVERISRKNAYKVGKTNGAIQKNHQSQHQATPVAKANNPE